MFSAEQGNHWYHLAGINPGPPALEASTLSLGYRGGVVPLITEEPIGSTKLQLGMEVGHDQYMSLIDVEIRSNVKFAVFFDIKCLCD